LHWPKPAIWFVGFLTIGTYLRLQYPFIMTIGSSYRCIVPSLYLSDKLVSVCIASM